MDAGGLGFVLMTIVSVLALAAVLLWAITRNKGSTPAERQRSEDATRELYRAEDSALDRAGHNVS